MRTSDISVVGTLFRVSGGPKLPTPQLATDDGSVCKTCGRTGSLLSTPTTRSFTEAVPAVWCAPKTHYAASVGFSGPFLLSIFQNTLDEKLEFLPSCDLDKYWSFIENPFYSAGLVNCGNIDCL